MGITERRDREREEVRQKILDAARDLFAREGYEHVTMRRIAEAIEYSPTTIYNHFEDKDDLVQSLCEEDFSRLLSALQTQPVPEDPGEWIRQLGLAYAGFGLSHPNHYRFMFMTPDKFDRPHEIHPPGKRFSPSSGALSNGPWKPAASGRPRPPRWRTSCGRAFTARWPCSSPCGPSIGRNRRPARS